MLGFLPGFAYLGDLPEALRLPRLEIPRVRLPAGSVAIAAEYTAVYPRPSPGGWHLLGTTRAVMFDPDRSPPALFQPGAHVRFVPA
jgi:KipI family sensor histidine kinase inhibitor